MKSPPSSRTKSVIFISPQRSPPPPEKKPTTCLMRTIELKCDLIALATLSNLRVKPSDLIAAVKKLIEARDQLKIESFPAGSPTADGN